MWTETPKAAGPSASAPAHSVATSPTSVGPGGASSAQKATLLTERSQLALPPLVAQNFVADAGFVDGSHAFRNIFIDLHFLRELVHPCGLVVLDDCHWPSVATAARYFELNTAWERQRTSRRTRLRAFRLPTIRADDADIEAGIKQFARGELAQAI